MQRAQLLAASFVLKCLPSRSLASAVRELGMPVAGALWFGDPDYATSSS